MRVYYFVVHNADGEGVATTEHSRFPCLTYMKAVSAKDMFESYVTPDLIGQYTYTIEEGWL